jgi:transposase InsO family protein
VIAALTHALQRRQVAPGLLHHSDRGSQYASADYQALLAQAQMRSSMSRKGDCWDNAAMESFFATLKAELPVTVFESRRPRAARCLTTSSGSIIECGCIQRSVAAAQSPMSIST